MLSNRLTNRGSLAKVLVIAVLALAVPLIPEARGAANPTPSISALSPASATVGSPTFVLVVTGNNFTSSSEIFWNGTGIPTSFVHADKLTASISSSRLTTASTAIVQVKTPNVSPATGLSNIVSFPITAAATAGITLGVQSYYAGGLPFASEVGDFNGDGKMDALVVSLGIPYSGPNPAITTLQGNGDGTFTTPHSVSTCSDMGQIAVGDLNGDGKLDVVGASYDNDICAHLGNGDGSFGSAIINYSYGRGNGLALGDFNGDGILDLAVATTDDGLRIFSGDGTGNFTDLGTPGVGSRDFNVVVGDFNGDGKLDVAVSDAPSSGNGTVHVLLGDGNYGFPTEYDITVGQGPQGMAVGDFNRDGHLDIAVANAYDGTISILLGNGAGSFIVGSTISVGGSPGSVTVGDFNGDGFLDIAASSFSAGTTIPILLGNGDGTFAAPLNLPAKQGSSWISAADFNNDGRLDFILPYPNCGSWGCGASGAAILLQSPAVTFPPALDFGTHSVGSVTPNSITLDNTGSAPYKYNTLQITQPSTDFALLNTSTCSTTTGSLLPGASCTLDFTFTPQASSPRSGTFTLSDNNANGAPGNPESVALTGSGSLLATTTSISAPAISYGQTGAVTVSVSSGGNPVAGSVTLSVDAGTPAAQTLAGGSTLYNIPGLAAGDHTLVAVYAAQGGYDTSSTSGVLHVNKADQTITLTPPPASAPYQGTFTLSATASSGLSVTFGASGACGLAGNLVTMNSGTGTCTVTADQAGNSNYNAAPEVSAGVVAQLIAPTVTFTGAPATANYLATFTVAATSNASTTPTITATGACSIAAHTVTMSSGTGLCSLTANWAADSNYISATLSQSTTAAKIAPTVTFTGAPASAAYNSSFAVAATTNASTTATITALGACSVLGNNVTMSSGTGTCNLTANWAADNNYNAATASQNTAAAKLAPTVTLTGVPATAIYNSSFSVGATSNSSSPAALSVAGACSLLGNSVTMTSGTGACAVTANWVADNNYNAASLTQTATAAKATPLIVWPTPANIAPSTPLGAAQLDATAVFNALPVAGTFIYTPPAGTVLLNGNHQALSVSFAPADSTDFNPATGTVYINVIDTTPPAITISANPGTLWSPNGKPVSVTVFGTITDTGSGINPATVACRVVDSYGLDQPACSVGPLGAGGAYSFTLSLVASRLGTDKTGRTYTIVVTASDNASNPASATTVLLVPHDQGQ